MKPYGYQTGLNYGYGSEAIPQPTPEQIEQLKQSLPPVVNPIQSEIVQKARDYTSFCGDKSLHRTAEQVIFATSLVLPTLLGFIIGMPFGKKGRFALYGFGLGAIRGGFYVYSTKRKIKERCGE
tara:strand:+ start:7 stop:378 length:372 start_codon:yes stop_codon:yes gene_type:complete